MYHPKGQLDQQQPAKERGPGLWRELPETEGGWQQETNPETKKGARERGEREEPDDDAERTASISPAPEAETSGT